MLDPQRTAGRVVFVCEGNTCRSPLAEVIARQMFGGDGSRFASAGLDARPGQPAAPPARQAAADLGLDLAAHRSRPLGADVLEGAGWCLAMTRGQAARLRALGVGRRGVRIGLLGAPGGDLTAGPTPDCEEVADPWGADLRTTYRRWHARAQIRRLLTAWAPHLAAAPDQEGTP